MGDADLAFWASKLKGKIDAIVVGGSAGAVEALAGLLPALPSGFGLPIIGVVHLPPDRPSLLAEIFAPKCRLPVREVEDKDKLAPGVWFAPSNYHLLIEQERSFALSTEDPVMFSRPSIDVLFESAAEAFEERLLGIVLTGANSDGAEGLRRVVDRGGVAWVQSPQTAQSSAMPAAALARVPEATALTLEQIATFLPALGAQVAGTR